MTKKSPADKFSDAACPDMVYKAELNNYVPKEVAQQMAASKWAPGTREFVDSFVHPSASAPKKLQHS